jgi:hypothetical protein
MVLNVLRRRIVLRGARQGIIGEGICPLVDPNVIDLHCPREGHRLWKDLLPVSRYAEVENDALVEESIRSGIEEEWARIKTYHRLFRD